MITLRETSTAECLLRLSPGSRPCPWRLAGLNVDVTKGTDKRRQKPSISRQTTNLEVRGSNPFRCAGPVVLRPLRHETPAHNRGLAPALQNAIVKSDLIQRYSRPIALSHAGPRLQQAEFREFRAQLWRQALCARQRTGVRGSCFRIEVAPALKWPMGAPQGGNKLRLVDQAASGNTVLASRRPDVEKPLACGNLALDDPIERAAVEEFLRTLRRLSGHVNEFRPALSFSNCSHAAHLPTRQVLERFDSHAKLDEMKCHVAAESRGSTKRTTTAPPST